MGIEECKFCEVGQYNRALMWRLVNDLSRADLKELIKKKKEGILL